MSNENLTLGRGELYFDRFLPGTRMGEGERYLGNTPGFTLARSTEQVERFESYGGQKIKRYNLITREMHTADIQTDNMSMDNIALWFGHNVDEAGQPAIGTINEQITVRRGRFYQLGNSLFPFGVRHVEPDIVFERNGDVLPLQGNLTLDRTEGRFFVLEDAVNVADGDLLSITFQWRSSSSEVVVAAPQEIEGALRYIATNPHGPRVNYFFPYVSMRPSGQMDFKADNWQQISFDVEVRKKNPVTEFFYALRTAGPLLTDDEQAIIDFGPISLEEFALVEDILHQSVNFGWPAAVAAHP